MCGVGQLHWNWDKQQRCLVERISRHDKRHRLARLFSFRESSEKTWECGMRMRMETQSLGDLKVGSLCAAECVCLALHHQSYIIQLSPTHTSCYTPENVMTRVNNLAKLAILQNSDTLRMEANYFKFNHSHGSMGVDAQVPSLLVLLVVKSMERVVCLIGNITF